MSVVSVKKIYLHLRIKLSLIIFLIILQSSFIKMKYNAFNIFMYRVLFHFIWRGFTMNDG